MESVKGLAFRLHAAGVRHVRPRRKGRFVILRVEAVDGAVVRYVDRDLVTAFRKLARDFGLEV